MYLSDRAYKCPAGHSYDISSKGYVNLLLSNTAGHGDSKDMVLARRSFLEKGYYAPLAEKIVSAVKKYDPSTLLDIGCGEGYYTEKVKNALPGCDVYGFDISKEAASRAAKRCKECSIAVAGAYKMPYKTGAFDLMYNIFSPLAPDEIGRGLKKGGIFIYAVSGREHLIELKRAVYDSVFVKEEQDDKISGFELTEKDSILYNMELDSPEDIRALFDMTPYSKKTSRSDREKLNKLEKLQVTAAFNILIYTRL